MIRATAVFSVVLMVWLIIGKTTHIIGQVGDSSGLVNPNLAGEEELHALPHLTDKLVQELLDNRPFLSMTELNNHLSQSLEGGQLEELYERFFVPINLNTASRNEILLGPGVGDRLAHEFEEYRPYRAVRQFRREIGKYVDSNEVQLLERHVFVPININSASDEDLLSIPGVGQRMLHEFKEYRPYRGIAEFRREIGKYVDSKEIKRLERYIIVE